MCTIRRKRIYEAAEVDDGYRILVDRLWPRGMKKENAHLDRWAKEVTPSKEIRQLYHRGEMDFASFGLAYLEELERNPAAQKSAADCRSRLETSNITFVYGAKNQQENHVIVLLKWLNDVLKQTDRSIDKT